MREEKEVLREPQGGRRSEALDRMMRRLSVWSVLKKLYDDLLEANEKGLRAMGDVADEVLSCCGMAIEMLPKVYLSSSLILQSQKICRKIEK